VAPAEPVAESFSSRLTRSFWRALSAQTGRTVKTPSTNREKMKAVEAAADPAVPFF